MKAAWYETPGPARDVLRIGTRDDPVPGPGEVRVRVYWSAVNPTDVKRRAGRSDPVPGPFVVPHMDGSGVIDAIGAQVPPSRIGRRVWLHFAALKRPGGTCAQYAVVPSGFAVDLPDDIDFREGATLGVPALTAHRAVFGFGAVRDRTVLVTGGAGRVGFYAIQLARWGGARVLATTGSEKHATEARRAGAELSIDYKREDVAQKVLEFTDGAGIDHLVEVDFGANLPATMRMMKPLATIAAYGSADNDEPRLPFRAMQARALSLMVVALFSLPAPLRERAAADVTAWLGAGSFEPPARIHEFSLEDVAAAHAAVESATPGAVLVRIP